MNMLEQLKKVTTVVADTGDIGSIAQYKPQDATTNPSLLLKASRMEEYADLVAEAVSFGKGTSGTESERLDATIDKLGVIFGSKILEIIPGRVSTEVDAHLSFDRQKTVDKARQIIKLYGDAGIDKDRILIKIASTWEGISAADQLEDEGIHCNLTLMFGFGQAVACAEAGVTLISPFVGRIYDWYKKEQGVDDIPLEDDPGVQSVTNIYNYFKKYDHKTVVMGASFRKAGQILELSGCDLLTISPGLLAELQGAEGTLERRLDPESARALDIDKVEMNENNFRWMLNEDPMATEKLAHGIRAFAKDLRSLRTSLAK